MWAVTRNNGVNRKVILSEKIEECNLLLLKI
jgi:hypothetical protein